MPLFSRAPATKTVTAPHLPSARVKGAEFPPDVIHTLRNYGLGVSSYGAMYRRQPAVRAVVDWIARNIGQLNPKVYQRAGDVDRIEDAGHPLARLLRNPNPATSRFAHLRDTVADLAVFDLAYWVKDRNEFPTSIVRYSPTQVTTEVVDRGTPQERRVFRGPDGRRIPRDRLVVFHGYNPDGAGEGVSPLETLRRVLAEEMASQAHREGFWRNAARQHGTIERPMDAPEWSDEARKRFRADWEAATTSVANAGRTAILEDGMKWNAASFSPKDSLYIEGRRLTYEEVAIQYGLLDVGKVNTSASNQEQSHRERYQDVLGPWLRMLQDEIELQLVRDFEPFAEPGQVYVEFNLAEKLKGSFEEQQKALTTAVGVPHMSVNEGRARVNLPRIDEDWADMPVQPLNVMYGGQPAVTVPTADPSTAAEAAARVKARVEAERSQADEAAESIRFLFVSYFERQERTIMSLLSSKSQPGRAKSDRERARWDRELAANLYTTSAQTVASHGQRTAVQMGGTFDESRTRGWVLANSRRTAESVNAHTFEALEQAADLDEARQVFEVAKGSRAEMLGVSLGTGLLAFARVEAGRHTADQGRQVMKTWRVTSGKSRHPHLDGESVPVDQPFSNGAMWPGDPSAGADESAGCNCVVDIGETP